MTGWQKPEEEYVIEIRELKAEIQKLKAEIERLKEFEWKYKELCK